MNECICCRHEHTIERPGQAEHGSRRRPISRRRVRHATRLCNRHQIARGEQLQRTKEILC